jgi:hypothetical protein
VEGASWGAAPELNGAGIIVFADRRAEALGGRFLIPAADDVAIRSIFFSDEASYHARRILLGVPEGGRDYAFGEVFPHDICLDLLGGVSFDKGCFVGQEVVSRMRHRGTARTRVLLAEGLGELPQGRPDITADGFAVAKLGSVAGSRGIALARLDRVRQAVKDGQTLLVGTTPVTLTPPAWADYTLDG